MLDVALAVVLSGETDLEAEAIRAVDAALREAGSAGLSTAALKVRLSTLCARNASSLLASPTGNLEPRFRQRSRLDSRLELASSRVLGWRLGPRPRLVAILLLLDRPRHSFRGCRFSRRQYGRQVEEERQGQDQGEGG